MLLELVEKLLALFKLHFEKKKNRGGGRRIFLISKDYFPGIEKADEDAGLLL